MIKTRDKILLCAGGTGGHVFPAVAVAEIFTARGMDVFFITDTRGAKFLKDTPYTYEIVSSATFTGGIMGKLKCIFPLISGFFESIGLIWRYKPDGAIGFGGYPTVPPMVAAFICRIPTITHEANAILGLANILLAPFVKFIAVSHTNTANIKKWFAQKIKVTGNPVRGQITALSTAPYPLIDKHINIMVVGGSLGAKVFSTKVVEAICNLPFDIKSKLNITQQSRAEDLTQVVEAYRQASVMAEVKEFYTDMPARLRDVHLLIARSGAGTVTELTMAGRPAIYIPYPYNRDRQQYFNAAEVERAQGGWVMDELTLTSDALKTQLIQLLQDPSGLAQHGANARTLARPVAAVAVANLMIEKIGFTS
jgi:UDP-N-acetylglucosamine--N-acetylmuramyl-(pentapeptide) pyrophosphoryl-undecaprenol N-acetylglucosamine transferase